MASAHPTRTLPRDDVGLDWPAHAQSTTAYVMRPIPTDLHTNTAVHEHHVSTDSIAELQPSIVREPSCGWIPQRAQGYGRMANDSDLLRDVPWSDPPHEEDKAVTYPIGPPSSQNIAGLGRHRVRDTRERAITWLPRPRQVWLPSHVMTTRDSDQSPRMGQPLTKCTRNTWFALADQVNYESHN